ncbi:hypothetical protein ACFL1A_02550 [Patescibacteria group bacterium]
MFAIFKYGIFFTIFYFCFLIRSVYAEDGILQFKSGFEGGTHITGEPSITSSKDGWIEGIDSSVPTALGDWSKLKNNGDEYLDWLVQAAGWFQGGRMEIVQDPAGFSNKVLRLHNTNVVGGVSRSSWELRQAVYWNNDGKPNRFDKQFYRFKIYIPSDITTVASYSRWSPWYMIWESHAWAEEYFSDGEKTRYAIYLRKRPNSNHWYFSVQKSRPTGCGGYNGPLDSDSCELYWDNQGVGQIIPVPFDQWFTFELFFKYSETGGEWYVAITRNGEQREVVAHFQGQTKYDQKLHDQMMFKMYHNQIYTQELGETNQYYDDFEIWSDYPPGYFSGASSTPISPKLGDSTGDGIVDGADYIIWLNHYGQNVEGVENGNFDGLNGVDGADYIVWLNNYGN